MSSNVSATFRRRLFGGAIALSLLAVPSLALAASPAKVSVSGSSSSADNSSETGLSRIETIAFSTVVVDDPDLPADVEVVETEGHDGMRHIYTTSGYTEGSVPTYRSVVVEEPVDRVIHRGVADALPAVSEPEPIVEPEPEPEVASRGNDRSEPAAENLGPVSEEAATSAQYSLSQFMFAGVVNWGGYKFTYYSQSVLPGGGLAIPGRHINAGGYVADADGYIVLAAPYGVSHGTVFSTPFGASGKVYDTCGSCSTSPMWLDVYTR